MWRSPAATQPGRRTDAVPAAVITSATAPTNTSIDLPPVLVAAFLALCLAAGATIIWFIWPDRHTGGATASGSDAGEGGVADWGRPLDNNLKVLRRRAGYCLAGIAITQAAAWILGDGTLRPVGLGVSIGLSVALMAIVGRYWWLRRNGSRGPSSTTPNSPAPS